MDFDHFEVSDSEEEEEPAKAEGNEKDQVKKGRSLAAPSYTEVAFFSLFFVVIACFTWETAGTANAYLQPNHKR